jgi:hypothetical protein
MDSWWELGEGGGFPGDKMEVWRITCPFCEEKGNFELAFHADKKKSNSAKKLNFDIYKCKNCVGYVHVLWSAGEFSSSYHGLYNFQAFPYPLGEPTPSEVWPNDVQRFWRQAKSSLTEENWDAAAVMARSALQAAMRDKDAGGSNLKTEIEHLSDKGLLPPLMKNWSHEIRLLANDSAHPKESSPPPLPEDARDIVRFLEFLLMYLYDLPKEIANYRQRREGNTQNSTS